MNRKAETFFDDIIKALVLEQESAKFADLKHETAVEFYTDTLSVPAIPTQVASVPVPHVDYSISYTSPSAKTAPPFYPQDKSTTPDLVPLPVEPPVPVVDPATFPSMDMQALQEAAHNCSRCDLHKNRKNVVFGIGNIHADLMFIGEGPGRDEDLQGVPFVGDAGQLLTKMINAMQFSRSDVYIANIVKCRPPKNRNPEDNEAEACMLFLQRQIELIAPKVIVVLGAVPLKYLLNKTGITKHRGLWDAYKGIQVMPTFHPAYLLRTPSAKKQTWEDLQKVMQVLGKTPVSVQQR